MLDGRNIRGIIRCTEADRLSAAAAPKLYSARSALGLLRAEYSFGVSVRAQPTRRSAQARRRSE
jgi:hypothetical protein